VNHDTDGPVLVVHDDAEIRELITGALELEGIASTAGTHADALSRLGGRRPGLVLLDLYGDAAGFRAALARRHGRGVPIVGLTTNAARRDGADVGAQALLPMPFELDELVIMVGRFCQAN
jgi:DNA-binding response OmpR family regulator